MILTMRITSKGQVTIPKAVREEAGLHPGMDVEFTIEDGKVQVSRSRSQPSAADELIARLQRSRPHFSMTTEEIMELTRGED